MFPSPAPAALSARDAALFGELFAEGTSSSLPFSFVREDSSTVLRNCQPAAKNFFDGNLEKSPISCGFFLFGIVFPGAAREITVDNR